MPKFLNEIDMRTNKIVNLGDPTNTQDAATKKYVDDLIAGRDNKDAVRAASTGNLSLSGAQTVDGVALVAGDRVLVKNQTTPKDNGIYVVATGAWARAIDADSWADLSAAFVIVEEGTVNVDKVYLSTTNGTTGILGTDSIIWAEFGTIANYTGGSGITVSGSVISIGTGAITSTHIADGTIATADLADNSVTSAKIVDGTIAAGDLGSNAVTTVKILDANVTTAKIADGNITEAKLNATVAGDGIVQNATSKKLEVAPDNTSIALTGTTPNKTVQVKDLGVSTAKIADSAVTNVKLGADAVTGTKIADNAIAAEHITDGSVGAAELASNSVTTIKILDANVTTTKIADSNVTTAKIADSAVTSVKIADGTIVAGDLANDSVITTKILNANVTGAKLADGAVDLTTAKVTGVLPVTKGGTGATTELGARVAIRSASTYIFTLSTTQAEIVKNSGALAVSSSDGMGFSSFTALSSPANPGELTLSYNNIPGGTGNGAFISSVQLTENNVLVETTTVINVGGNQIRFFMNPASVDEAAVYGIRIVTSV